MVLFVASRDLCLLLLLLLLLMFLCVLPSGHSSKSTPYHGCQAQAIKDAIFDMERLLLDTMEYRLQIDVPYPILLELVQQKKPPLEGRPGT